MNLGKKSRGFTLVELLLGMSLTILVGGVLYLLQSTGMTTVKKGASQLMLTSEIRNKMERIVSDVRNSKEILEIRPDMIKLRCYKYSGEQSEPGESALVTVTYEVERNERRHILWRTVNRENPIQMLSLQRIGNQIFYPYFEADEPQTPPGWVYRPFNMVENDSFQRQRITHIKIQLEFSQGSESAVLVTSATMRPAASRLRQPNWKFR